MSGMAQMQYLLTLINLITAASRKNKLGVIGIKIKSKDSIREFCEEALDFTDDIMNNLF